MTKFDHKSSQFLEPLFEYSGACAGCGETPYLKLLTQLFGDRLLMANATGCSSIYGGNLPTTPYTTNRDGRGPAWSNSLFEDNAEFGFGFRMALDAHVGQRAASRPAARVTDRRRAGHCASGRGSVERRPASPSQRDRVVALRQKLAGVKIDEARRLETFADYLVKKSVWLIGGDGWAYDIGYGGLDHVLANRRDVNILVMDTEVYSNTGGQASKATPLGAAAKFAAAGKPVGKKDLGLLANMYGHVYVAKVAFGAKMAQTAQAFLEAESYHGPSLIIAYSHCIAHGYDMAQGASQQKLAVDSGVWPLYRFDPRRIPQGRSAPAPGLRPAEGRRWQTTCATNRASGWSSAPIPPATRCSSRNRRRQPSAGMPCYQQLAGIKVPAFPRPTAQPASPDGQGEVMDLSTTYLGKRLPHPLVVGAGPLGDDLDTVKALEDAGAAMLVLRSLYEEEIVGEQMDAFFNVDSSQRCVQRSRILRAGIRRCHSGPTSTSSICAGSSARSAFR